MGILTDTFTNPWESLLLRPMQGWLAEHPLVGWLVGHPLWALALAIVGLLLFAGLWSAIARLTEGFWLALVRLPFRLSSWMFAALSAVLVRRWVKPSRTAGGSDRLSEIMGRLETLQTEQETLLGEMRDLLGKQADGRE
ncbi:hypothetical protein [Nodosilinea nodulosa]|uniref:hypothetical protein n=1 Tax=Nodosilinea nodulosa TaxID=416001 RepID=UPI0002DD8259|nr:hypothetical protein [Nodosilinea nodulosa]